jgi:hypothetical protein
MHHTHTCGKLTRPSELTLGAPTRYPFPYTLASAVVFFGEGCRPHFASNEAGYRDLCITAPPHREITLLFGGSPTFVVSKALL